MCIYRNIRHIEAIIYSISIIFLFQFISAIPLYADQAKQQEFENRMISAFESKDDGASFLNLFYLEGADDEYKEFCNNMAKESENEDPPQITFEKLSADYNPISILDGYEYKLNLKPLGKITLKFGEKNASISIPYGEKNREYYFAGRTKTLVNPDAKPDKQLIMMVYGQAPPSLKFDGYCNIMQSNNKTKKLMLSGHLESENQAAASKVKSIAGQYIEKCEINNTSQSKILGLRLQEDGQTIFEHQIELPETKIIYLKKK